MHNNQNQKQWKIFFFFIHDMRWEERMKSEEFKNELYFSIFVQIFDCGKSILPIYRETKPHRIYRWATNNEQLYRRFALPLNEFTARNTNLLKQSLKCANIHIWCHKWMKKYNEIGKWCIKCSQLSAQCSILLWIFPSANRHTIQDYTRVSDTFNCFLYFPRFDSET